MSRSTTSNSSPFETPWSSPSASWSILYSWAPESFSYDFYAPQSSTPLLAWGILSWFSLLWTWRSIQSPLVYFQPYLYRCWPSYALLVPLFGSLIGLMRRLIRTHLFCCGCERLLEGPLPIGLRLLLVLFWSFGKEKGSKLSFTEEQLGEGFRHEWISRHHASVTPKEKRYYRLLHSEGFV